MGVGWACPCPLGGRPSMLLPHPLLGGLVFMKQKLRNMQRADHQGAIHKYRPVTSSIRGAASASREWASAQEAGHTDGTKRHLSSCPGSTLSPISAIYPRTWPFFPVERCSAT